jgi:transposase
VFREAKVLSEPDALISWFSELGLQPAQEVRSVLTARKLVQGKLHDVEMCIRGVLRGFGLKVGPTTRKTFEPRIKELIEGHPTLTEVAGALLKVRDVLAREFRGLDRRVQQLARQDDGARRLMSMPGVGSLVALTFVSGVDEPERFRSSRAVGPHFGLTPKKYQSGETDYTGRISKIGDAGVRTALYEAANVILTRPVKGSDLKTWALGVAKRAGMRKAKVALARKLAVVLHRILRDGSTFVAHKAAAQAA